MKSPFSFRLSSLTALLLLSLAGGAYAQSNAKDGLSDAERAKRDAEKVFSFIKFSTVKPAAAPAAPAAAAANPPPVRGTAPALAAQAAPAATRAAASPATQAAALAAVQAAAAANAAAQAPAAANAAAAAPSATQAPTPGLAAATAPAGAAPAAAATPTAATAATPATAAGLAATTAMPPAPATQPEPEPEEVPLKLIAYTAPELNQRVLSALGDKRIVVPVRFKVEADGRVSAAKAMGSAPRVIEMSAVRAVEQWKFDKLPASREVDVEVAFKAGD